MRFSLFFLFAFLATSAPAFAAPSAKEIKPGTDEATILGNIAMIYGIQLLQESADMLGDPAGALDGAAQLAQAASIYVTGKKLADVSGRSPFAKGRQLKIYPSVFKSTLLTEYVSDFEEQVGMKIDTAVSSLNKGVEVGILSKSNSASVSSGLISDATRNAPVLSIPDLLRAMEFNVGEIEEVARSFRPQDDEKMYMAGQAPEEFRGATNFSLTAARSPASASGGSFFGGGAVAEMFRGPASEVSGIRSTVVTNEGYVYKAEVSEDILNAFARRDGNARPLFETVHERYQKLAPFMLSPFEEERTPAAQPNSRPYELDTKDVQL